MSIKKKDFKSFNVVVIGDTCTDRFVYGYSERLAPEAPVPVFNPINETTNPGMSGNVVRNIESLGGNAFLVSNKITPIKTRYVDIIHG
jgi:D-beta-D-heptose 7-phosphate kinase/D-beta-D-heptose 1-phosphate adenosyltransferase